MFEKIKEIDRFIYKRYFEICDLHKEYAYRISDCVELDFYNIEDNCIIFREVFESYTDGAHYIDEKYFEEDGLELYKAKIIAEVTKTTKLIQERLSLKEEAELLEYNRLKGKFENKIK